MSPRTQEPFSANTILENRFLFLFLLFILLLPIYISFASIFVRSLPFFEPDNSVSNGSAGMHALDKSRHLGFGFYVVSYAELWITFVDHCVRVCVRMSAGFMGADIAACRR